MNIAYLGAGAWGFALANLLGSKGYRVKAWTIASKLAKQLNATREHPMLPGGNCSENVTFSTDLAQTLEGCDLIVESVTSAGIRPVFEQVKELTTPTCPIVLTSKGIEQNTGLILSDVIVAIFGEEIRPQLAAISGPSYASEVIHHLPTSVVGSAYNKELIPVICNTFRTENFRVYPNEDIRGVAYGGALKNVIAIACGVAKGLNLGYSARAALMTRGLHEINKLATAAGCQQSTIYGLSGMGDLCVTCSAMTSRNFKFGYLLTKGKTSSDAKEEVGMVVEGAYTAVSALQLSRELNIPMPITETVHKILYEGLSPEEAVKVLMERSIKEEHL